MADARRKDICRSLYLELIAAARLRKSDQLFIYPRKNLEACKYGRLWRRERLISA